MEHAKKKNGTVKKIFKGIGKTLGTIILVGGLACVIFLCIFTAYMRNYLMPQVEFSLDGFRLNQTSTIYYQDPDTGNYKTLQNLYGSENRIWATYKEIPVNLIYATVAIEDKRFFEHEGVDWLRTARASVNLFMGSDSTYGASTLTQQLVKNLTKDDQVTVRRKLVEIFRALEMEEQYSKEDIMEWYLNTIYLGEQAYGVRTAAYTYFGKDVSELDLAECASLIAITNNPSIYDPYISDYTREKNRERQLYILYEMMDQGYITQAEYEEARNKEMVFVYAEYGNDEAESGDYYSYFVDQVVRDVVTDLSEVTGYDTEVVNQMILNGGYQIYSTIDIAAQAAAEEIYENLDNIPETESTYQQLQSGIVIIDNETGDIAAIVGGVGEKQGSLTYSRATQSLLAPGSTMKPIVVYGPALEQGIITPATVYDDTPVTFGATPWPKNEDDKYYGLTTVVKAMEKSTNTIAVKVLEEIGVDAAFEYAVNELELDTLVDSVEIGGSTYTDRSQWSLALGGTVNGITVRDLTAAYAAVENGGTYREARTYTKVLDSEGNLILDNTQDSHQILSEKSAYYLTYMMEEVVKDGTGVEAAIEGMSVAGKTGTTDDDKDRWFAGYTPYYTAAVWCGYDQPQEVILADETLDNPAANLWNQVMTKLSEGQNDTGFTKPTDMIEVTVCSDSGLLPTGWCENECRGNRTETVILSTEDVPTDYCTIHVEETVCFYEGEAHIANSSCEAGGTAIKCGMLNYNRQFPIAGIVVADQQYCVGYQLRKSGNSIARCDTLSPANEECTVWHPVEVVETEAETDPAAEPEVDPAA